jgi:hypothetical protein
LVRLSDSSHHVKPSLWREVEPYNTFRRGIDVTYLSSRLKAAQGSGGRRRIYPGKIGTGKRRPEVVNIGAVGVLWRGKAKKRV